MATERRKNTPIPQNRNPNLQPRGQGYIMEKMDKMDRYVEKHSMRVYIESLKNNQLY